MSVLLGILNVRFIFRRFVLTQLNNCVTSINLYRNTLLSRTWCIARPYVECMKKTHYIVLWQVYSLLLPNLRHISKLQAHQERLLKQTRIKKASKVV